MRVFKIFDEDLDNKEIGILLHYDLQNEFIVELCDDVDEWQAPVLFSSFVKKGLHTISKEASYLWIKERIPPTGRQNIGMILKNMKLTKYSEIRLLVANDGRSSQDYCYIEEIKSDELPSWLTERQKGNIRDCFPIVDNRVICLLQNDDAIEIDLKKCITYNPKLASVIRNIEVLNTLQVDAGGYGITFNNSIYLDAETLCSNGVILPIYANVFYDFVKHSIINTTEACEILECSRQNLSYMVKQGSVTPLKLGWKENVFLRGDITGV